MMESDTQKLHTLQVPKVVRVGGQGLDNSRLSGGLSDDSEGGLGYQNTLVSVMLCHIVWK